MNAALAFYAQLHNHFPRRAFTLQGISEAARRAGALPPERRERILVKITHLHMGAVTCPHCNFQGGPLQGCHTTNGHHKIARLAYVCRACNATFLATEIKS